VRFVGEGKERSQVGGERIEREKESPIRKRKKEKGRKGK
jgi:hypothetical protein